MTSWSSAGERSGSSLMAGTTSGEWSTIRRSPPTTSVSRARARALSLVSALSTLWRKATASAGPACSSNRRASSVASRSAYQVARTPRPAKFRTVSRYWRAVATTTSRRSASSNPRARPATARLAARRLRSHSQGPGSVSSKSLSENTRSRSGEAKPPKFERWASPQAWTRRPDTGVVARSAAMTATAPRKNVNGDVAMRWSRMVHSSGTRVVAWRSRMAIGSSRPAGGSHTAWPDRGAWARAARPRAARSSGVSAPRPLGARPARSVSWGPPSGIVAFWQVTPPLRTGGRPRRAACRGPIGPSAAPAGP